MKEIKIFKIGDSDWIASETLEQALIVFKGISDLKDDMECHELSDHELDNLKFRDEECEDENDEEMPTNERSFRDELKNRIDKGEEFPQYFASSEYY